MGKSTLHWVWVLVGLALNRERTKSQREEKSWAGSGRGGFCVCLERKQWDMGKEWKEPHPPLHPSPAVEVTPSHWTNPQCPTSPIAPLWLLWWNSIPWDVSHPGTTRSSISLLCNDILMCSPPIQAHHKPLELSSSLKTSAECKPKDVPPFPLFLTSEPNPPCSRQISSLWRKPSHPLLPCNASWGRATQGKGKGKMRFPWPLLYLCPLISDSTGFLKLIGFFVNCCVSY